MLSSAGLELQGREPRVQPVALDELRMSALGDDATLVHDDLVDESPLRRGMPAIHLAYAPEVAVRVGDYYFGRAADLLASLDNHRATRLIVEAVADVWLVAEPVAFNVRS